MSFIAADIEKPPATVFSYLLYHGGIEPRTRIRRPDALSLDERELISRGLARGDSMRSIAKDLNRASEAGIASQCIQLGKPQQYAHIERFNRTVQYEWLSQYYRTKLDEVQDFAT